jgi:hypothetical protein
MSLEMAHKVIVPPKKNYIPQFLKQRDINSYFSSQIFSSGKFILSHSPIFIYDARKFLLTAYICHLLFFLIIKLLKSLFRCGGARSALQPEDVGMAGVGLLCCRGLVQVITAFRGFVLYRYLIFLGSVVDPNP